MAKKKVEAGVATLTAAEAFETVKQSAVEGLPQRKPVYRAGTMSHGDYWRQGDVLVYKMADPDASVEEVKKIVSKYVSDNSQTRLDAKGWEEVKNPSAKVVPDDGTQGSQHIVKDMRGVRVFMNKSASELIGPVLFAENGFELTHPEHNHCGFESGFYLVTYQRALADEERRVRD